MVRPVKSVFFQRIGDPHSGDLGKEKMSPQGDGFARASLGEGDQRQVHLQLNAG